MLLEGNEKEREGRISFSRILEAGQRREIGRKDLPWFAGLPALRRGIMMACFQMAGIHAVITERLKILHR